MKTVNSSFNSENVWQNPRLVRGRDAKVFGVISGISEYLGLDVTLMRVATILLGILTFGTAFLFYLLLAISLPKAGELPSKRILGVCNSLSKRYNWEVGIVRFGAALLALSSFGLALVGYVAVYFVLPDEIPLNR
jgi:phage shock protein C